MKSAHLVVAALLISPVASAQAWPSVAADLPLAGGGENDVAVVVGISEYPFLQKVPGAADNAADWFQYLVKVRGMPSERVTFLRDTDASKERIEKELAAAAKSAKAGGTAWLVFIGHGAPSPRGDDGLLLGVDTQPNADSLDGRGVPQERALSILKMGKQAQTIAIFDACFSGQTSDGSRPLVEGLQATPPVRKGAPAGKVAILSSSDTFAGPLPGQQRPAFSYVLLGAMRGWADSDGDRSVSIDEATAYTRNALRATLKTTERLPSARGQTSGVVLAKNVAEPGPEIEAIVLKRCPAGKRWKERRCEDVPCPTGTEWDGSTCAASGLTVKCPGGTQWDGSNCVAAGVACPVGTSWDGRNCVGASAPGPQVAVAPKTRPLPAPARPASGGNDDDGDGKSNSTDVCPTEAEDMDDFEDSDGCPDPDNDRDGVLDANDRCYNQAETKNGYEDADGCPDALPVGRGGRSVRFSETGIELLEQPLFASNKPQLMPRSFPMLDELTALLREYPALRIAIEAHTDSTGDDAQNLRLSQGRADAVVAYLVAKGIDAGRLEARGYGETMPIDSNTTVTGRARNRRVEIHLIK